MAADVVGALEECKKKGIPTIALTCNLGSHMAVVADHSIEVVVGPEYVTGSTRMKAGTAQKMVLNMLSTGVMIKLGRVVGNRMVDMQLSNEKLVKRGSRMVSEATGLSVEEAKELLLKEGSVRAAILKFQSQFHFCPEISLFASVKDFITIRLKDLGGQLHDIQAPTDMGFSLMEAIRANELQIKATCGGMAMCASCQCYVKSNHELPEMQDDEEAMLSEAFYVKDNSRLGCQIQMTPEMEGLEVELAPES